VGHNDVILLCVVRNVSTVPLPEKMLRVHCYPVAGLDYTDGDMTPLVPPLAPNQAVAFRWRLSSTESHQALIAAAQLENVGQPAAINMRQNGQSPITLAVVPRFDASPHFGAAIAGAELAPQAGVARGEAWLASNRVALRFLSSDRDEPLLLLAAKAGLLWHMVAMGLPLARVRSAEDGQTPWWETLRWRNARATADKDQATLTLYGNIGSRWGVQLRFDAHRDTGAIDGRLRLTARRTMRCYAVQLPRLLVTESDPGTVGGHADGSPSLLPDLEVSPLPEDARVAAAHQSGITFGLTWPLNPPLAGWTWTRISAPIGTSPTLSAECGVAEGTETGEVVLPGATLEFPFKLFALGPSDTVRDALRFIAP
jgi:hypothetical protein